jgi:hypothetical protein
VTLEAENLLIVVSSSEDVQKVFVAEPEAVFNVASDSSSLSLSLSSSSSTDSDDILIGQHYPKLTKIQSTTTKIYKKPSQTINFEPMAPLIYEKIGEMSVRRNQICERLPLNHPLQPQIIQPLNMVVPGEVSTNSERTSEIAYEAVANEEVISESPQQQPLEPQMAPSTSSSQILSEQTVPVQTTFIQPSRQLTIPVSEQTQPHLQIRFKLLVFLINHQLHLTFRFLNNNL